MRQQRLRAVFYRGGTSKALIFRVGDLPADRTAWDAIFLSAMGAPDPTGRQLDGMGGGLSSLNKVCVVAPPSRPDADVDYTFAQLSPDQAIVDYSGNCGNMSAAIGPFALEEGFVTGPVDGEASVRIHNTNTGKIIVARFPTAGGALAADGGLEIDGVAGKAAPIRLEFVEPGGAKTGKLLPTGSPTDVLSAPGLGEIEASCVDAANPCVFVDAGSVGMLGVELPAALESDAAFMQRMELIRRAGSVRMGLAADAEAAARLTGIPKVAMLAAPQAADADIVMRMISVGQPHRATPITGAICLAVAARLPGSIPHRLSRSAAGPIRIAHPSGITMVDAEVCSEAGAWRATHGAVYRTARRMFEGAVLYRAP